MQFIDLAQQYQNLKNRIDSRIQNVLNHGKYIMGPEVFEFEEKLTDYVGVKHVITCANGTDALTLSLMALEIKKGDAVFCPTFTFFATAEAPAFLGATPVFVDSDPNTFNICPVDLEKQIKKIISEGQLNPKAIIAVDLFGLPASYPVLEKLAKKYNLKLIEDAAQGFGGSIHDKKAGSFGDIATTSFFPAKPLGCYGDGGAIFTNDDELAELVKSYRVHGKGSNKYDNIRIGMNSRLDTIQAAILLEKLEVFPNELISRNKVAQYYNNELQEKFITPIIPENYHSSWAQYTLRTKNRDASISIFSEKDIPTVIYYRKCMHQQTAFKFLECMDKDFPNASKFTEQVFSLPMSPYINDNDINIISKAI